MGSFITFNSFQSILWQNNYYQGEKNERQGKTIPFDKKMPLLLNPSYPQCESCSYCKKKVGPVNKHGIANKPTDYKAYTACMLSWAGLFFYFWVLGWSDPMLRFFKKFAIFMKVWSVKIAFAIWGVIVGTWDRIVDILVKFNDWILGG